jgi:CubicO group peptidase (beta-lactamase class C family)
MTLRDMARLGELVRCRGMAQGKQVVPGEWIDDMLQNGDPAAWRRGNPVLMPQGRYRSKWYLTREGGALCAIGIHGQWIYVDIAAGVTIAKQSSQALPVEEPTDHLLLAGFAAIAKSL